MVNYFLSVRADLQTDWNIFDTCVPFQLGMPWLESLQRSLIGTVQVKPIRSVFAITCSPHIIIHTKPRVHNSYLQYLTVAGLRLPRNSITQVGYPILSSLFLPATSSYIRRKSRIRRAICGLRSCFLKRPSTASLSRRSVIPLAVEGLPVHSASFNSILIHSLQNSLPTDHH